MTTNSNLLSIAIEHHQSGRLQEAEQKYREILLSDPNHADALHLIGVISHQVGNHIAAIEFISHSIQSDPNQAHVHNNLGGAYRALKRFPEAVNCYRKALELESQSAGTCINLGNALTDLGNPDEALTYLRMAVSLKPGLAAAQINLANGLKRQGPFDEAIECYHRAIEAQPDDIETRINLGNLLKERGNLAEAVTTYRQILMQSPDCDVAHLDLGVALKELGNVDEAIECFRRFLELKPDFAEAYNNLGVALIDRGNLEEATACYRKALALKPDYADAFNNLGNALTNRGDLDEAVNCFRRAMDLQPDFAKAHCNLGVALKGQGKIEEAIASYRQALRLNPDDYESFANLADALKFQGKLDDAIVLCRKALDLMPDFAEGYNCLGNVLKEQGKLDDATACYERAVELKPTFVDADSNLIYTRLFCHGFDPQFLLDDHRRWNDRHAAPLGRSILPHLNDRSPDRRLRIGYVSPDFRNHVVGRNLLPLFQEHDHRQFEIYCYANVPSPDELTERFRRYADQFCPTASMNDAQLAQRIRDDRVDILIDLTLHMAMNRLLVFARKPAPVQVTFAGYPGTTGLTTIDYRITDQYLDPPGASDEFYSEESIRLPDTFWCYDPLDRETTVGPIPAEKNGFITFGCLNNFCKLNAVTLKLWAHVLKANSGSRIVIMAGEGSHRQQVMDLLADEGVASNRVTFVGYLPRQQYLRSYRDIDIGLDTFPYNGHTTSLDAYWMGVPVVTLVGPTATGRAGLSQLMNLGLPELIAQDPEQYVNVVTELAVDLPRLSGLRSTLRERMQGSPLMDAKRFTRNIEAAYHNMWQHWCSQS